MKGTTILALILGFKLAILHFFATKLSLYWEIAWFDNLMHLLGGLTLIFSLWALADIGLIKVHWVERWRRLAALVATILISWEVLGIALIGYIKPNFLTDTALDIIFGILGVIVGWFFARALTKLE